MNVQSALALCNLPVNELTASLGEPSAAKLKTLLDSEDTTDPVVDKGPPQSISALISTAAFCLSKYAVDSFFVFHL